MSDTPKTDNAAVYAQEDSVYTPALYESDLEFVPADFARAQERRIHDLCSALRELLQDTQHVNHNCGDGADMCPVLNARQVLEEP